MWGSRQWHRYIFLRNSEDSETTTKISAHISQWLAPRRVRTALLLGLLFALLFVMSRYSTLPAQIREFVPSKNSSTTPAALPVAPPIVDDIDWSNFAYIQYVTNSNYLCNSLMILESLHRLGAKADRIMMYPEQWKVGDGTDGEQEESRFLAQARDQYGVKLVPIEIQTIDRGDSTWKDSFTKLLAFKQTQYKRLVSLDSDATVKQPMDELFLLPSAPVAMPRAYWLDQPMLSSQVIVIEPSDYEWGRIEEFMRHDDAGFDMDILDKLYKNSCIIIPHRRYDLLTAEFRSDKHESYFGGSVPWNGTKTLEEAKFIHFSDWPVPKPWLKADASVVNKNQPKCNNNNGVEDCTDRKIWLGLYRDFSERRQVRHK